MALSRYRSFMRVVEQWPLDPSKSAKRDIASVLRKKVGEAFSQGEASTIPAKAKCDRTLESLQKITSDFHKKKYPFTSVIHGATGMTYEEAHGGVSEEGMKVIEKEHGSSGLLGKIKFKFRAT